MLWRGKYQRFLIRREACTNMSTRFIAHCVYPDSRQVSGVEDPPFFFQFHPLTLWSFGSSDSLSYCCLQVSPVQNSKCRFKPWRADWPFYFEYKDLWRLQFSVCHQIAVETFRSFLSDYFLFYLHGNLLSPGERWNYREHFECYIMSHLIEKVYTSINIA